MVSADGTDMNDSQLVLSSWELCKRWGWRDQDLLAAMNMGLPAYERGTKRALSADDITRLGDLVKSRRPIDVHYTPAEVEQFQRDHPEIFPAGIAPRRPTEVAASARQPSRPKRKPNEPLHVSVEEVAERWSCSADQIRCLVADGLLSPPEGAGPEGWFDREAFAEGHDTPPSNFEIFKAERRWGKAAGWQSEAIHEFEERHPQCFEGEQLTSMPQVTPSSPPSTSVKRSGSSSRTSAKRPSPAEGGASRAAEPALAKGAASRVVEATPTETGASPAVELTPPKDGASRAAAPTPAKGGVSPAAKPTPAKAGASQAAAPASATASDLATDAADSCGEITKEDLEAAVEVAVEMCRWWGKQPENGKRPMLEAIAHVKQTLSHLCQRVSDARLKMIASKANPKPVQERPARRK